MSIVDVIEKVRREPPYAEPQPVFPEKRYVCTVFDPAPWDRSKLEFKLGVEIPPELAAFWDACGGIILYEDNLHGQWGLALHGPNDPDLLRINKEYHEDWAGSIFPGDLLFASCYGDRERGLIRCDRNARDYGSIIIVAEMDPRPDWDQAAPSIEEFILRFMEAHGEKYWEYHYQKKLAERAAQQKP